MLATETPKASRMPATEMDTKEAEEITVAIKNGFDNLGAKLLEARERKAYKALGYRSFESYCLTEFGKSTSSAYRIIENQKVISELEAEVARQYDESVSLKITGPQAQLLKKLPEVGSRLQAIEFAQKLAKSEERNPTTKHLELAVYKFSNEPEHYRSAIQKNFSQGVRVEALDTPKTSRGTVRKVDKLGQIYVELDDSGVKPVCFEAHELRALKDSEKPSTPLDDSIASKGDKVVLFAKGLEGRQGEIYTYRTGKKALVVLDGVTLPIDVAYAELELVKETFNTNSYKDKSWDENLVWESGKNTYYYFPDEDKIYSNRWPTGLTLTPYSHRGTPAEFVKNWEERFAGQVVESLVKDSDLNSLLIAQLIALPEQEKESFASNLFKNLAQFLPTNHTKLESAVDTDAEVEIEKLRRQNQKLQEQLVEAESAIVEMVELCQGGIELTQSPQNQLDNPPLHSEEKYFTAITLHQPWASLIAAGEKHYETRSWPTNYRGPIAIHAGKKFEQDEVLISLLGIPEVEVPLGVVVALADLTDCILMDADFMRTQPDIELSCGDWEVGRYAWKLENVRAIRPIPATGKQGLWKWNLDDWNPGDCDIELLESPQNQLDNPPLHSEPHQTTENTPTKITLEPWEVCPPQVGFLVKIRDNDEDMRIIELDTPDGKVLVENKKGERIAVYSTFIRVIRKQPLVEEFLKRTSNQENGLSEDLKRAIERERSATLERLTELNDVIKKGKSKKPTERETRNLASLKSKLEDLELITEFKTGQTVCHHRQPMIFGKVAGINFSSGGIPGVWVKYFKDGELQKRTVSEEVKKLTILDF
ncbi:ASCH domain-containing protein [Microcoleus sp. CAWBG640]|uniref:ASCH domain-containing protein n=1 Tax=Microcoleus sp. CAWBG640 TaxID=2841653 RepID=UPI00312B2F85